MSEFKPIDTLADLARQDLVCGDIEAGYIAGVYGAPEPIASTFSRAFWHGWRNGRVDGAHDDPDEYHARLAAAYSEPQWLH
jgi:hypothetical protein